MNRKALAEIGRISNLPTCVSNATAGFCLGGGNPWATPGLWLAAVAATACFYEAGMVLNDLCDLEIDRVERPGRPIPSGRISRGQAAALVALLFGAGMGLVAAVFPGAWVAAFVLMGLIVFYDRFHARFSFAPVIMGACRASVYWLAAAAAAGSGAPAWPMNLALGLYIVFVSLVARDEMSSSLSATQKRALTGAAIVLTMPLLLGGRVTPLALVALAAGFGWLLLTRSKLMGRRIPTMAAVGKLLAGMSLLDAIVLGVLQSPTGVALAWICFGGTLLGHRRVRGT